MRRSLHLGFEKYRKTTLIAISLCNIFPTYVKNNIKLLNISYLKFKIFSIYAFNKVLKSIKWLNN
jgi:hypothetical protein